MTTRNTKEVIHLLAEKVMGWHTEFRPHAGTEEWYDQQGHGTGYYLSGPFYHWNPILFMDHAYEVVEHLRQKKWTITIHGSEGQDGGSWAIEILGPLGNKLAFAECQTDQQRSCLSSVICEAAVMALDNAEKPIGTATDISPAIIFGNILAARQAAVEAVIPLEALVISGSISILSPELQQAIHHGIAAVRRICPPTDII